MSLLTPPLSPDRRAAASPLAPSVVHCRREPYDVYIGRPGRWGNPFKIGPDGDRTAVLARYEAWLRQQPALLADLPTLAGKILGCWCRPSACHGDILLKLLAEQGSPPEADPSEADLAFQPWWWYRERWVNPTKRRYYEFHLQQTLFGTWEIQCHWGSLDCALGNNRCCPTDHRRAGVALLKTLRKERRGYICVYPDPPLGDEA